MLVRREGTERGLICPIRAPNPPLRSAPAIRRDARASPTLRAREARKCATLSDMGFNPFRNQKRSATDIALVVVFVLLTLAVVAWGFFG